MAITKAVATLEQLGLCTVEGTKQKYIHFEDPFNELWGKANPYLINPVFKTVFVDELPKANLLKSNIMALPEYTDIAPGNQEYYAIEKTNFYALQKNSELVNKNEYEGRYCLEVFREFFKNHAIDYVIIGGTACDIHLEVAGFTPRATRDIDIKREGQ